MLMAAGLACLFVMTWEISRDPQAVARTLLDIARSLWTMLGF